MIVFAVLQDVFLRFLFHEKKRKSRFVTGDLIFNYYYLIFNSHRQNLTSKVDPRTVRVISIPALKGSFTPFFINKLDVRF